MPKTKKPLKRWFDLVASKDDNAPIKLYLYGNIGMWEIKAQDMVTALAPHAGKDIELRILSSGGSVAEGQAIHAALEDHDGKVTGIIDSVCASIASYIAMACDELYIRKGSQIMIHECRGGLHGTASKIRENLKRFDDVDTAMAEAIAEKSGKKVEDVRADITKDYWLKGQEAVDYGICDGLYEKGKEVKASFSASTPTAEEVKALSEPTAELLQEYDAPSELIAMYEPQQPVKPANPQPAEPEANQENDMTPEQIAALAAQVAEKLKANPTAQAPAALTAENLTPEIVAQITAQIEQAEKDRSDGIKAVFESQKDRDGIRAVLEACIADKSVTVEGAKDRLIMALCGAPSPEAGKDTPAPVVGKDTDTKAKHLGQIEAALHHKMGAENVEIEATNPYRYLDAKASIRSYFNAVGNLEAAGMIDNDLVAFAFNNGAGSGDLAPIFERGIKRIIRDNESKFKPWIQEVVTRQAMDIGKANLLLKTRDVTAPRVKNEHGEFAQIKLGADKEVCWLGTQGYEIQVSRELIMADDLGFIGTEVAKYVRRCSMVPQQTLIEMLKKNAPLDDGLPIFHEDRGNLVESPSCDAIAIDEMAGNMKDMTTNQGEDLGLSPKVLLTSGRAENTQKALLKTEIIEDKPNIAYDAVEKVIGTGQLAKAQKQFVIADPMTITGILEGYNSQAKGVQLETKEVWKSDGATFRIYIDSVVMVRDPRALQAWHYKKAA